MLIPLASVIGKQGSEMSDILQELFYVPGKATNVALACRQQEALLQVLLEKNKQFTVDFKIMTDILLQNVMEQNMQSKYPALEKNIFGGES